MKKLNEIIDNVKRKLIQIKIDFDLDFKKKIKIMKIVVEKLKRKFLNFLNDSKTYSIRKKSTNYFRTNFTITKSN